MFNIGDRVIYKPIDHRFFKVDETHRWCNAKAKIISTDTLNRYWIAFDEFPNCNNRDRVNRFCADEEELIKINRKGK